MRKKSFFANHAKSSAALISLGIHAVLLIIALSFVAVTVITREDQKFEAKPINRPKMKLRKLQVPVNIKKRKTQKPKLRKRIVVQPKLNQTMPDIKMPEITGVKGGLGNAAGDGFGIGGGVGFSMPEMKLFGVKSRGEKVFIILDASGFMMVDKMGGIPAYTIIKSELVRILEGLNPTVLFNIAIYGGGDHALFPCLVPASSANVAKVGEWLQPLNSVKTGMGDKDYGVKTKGEGGDRISGDFQVEPLHNTPGEWARPALLAMRQGADVVFLLTCRWGSVHYKSGTRDRDWSESDQQRYVKNLAKAKVLFKKENERRRTKGQPPRVIMQGDYGIVSAYIPGTRTPPNNDTYHGYTPMEMVEAFANTLAKGKPDVPVKSGLRGRKKRKRGCEVNVIQFVAGDAGSSKDMRLSKLARLTSGEYSRVEGMEAIQSYVSSSDEGDLADN
jgi:hypothetical protein